MEYYFYHLAYQDSKVPKHFIELIQMQCSPFLDCNWGKQNDHTACWHQLHPQYQVLHQGMSQLPARLCKSRVTEPPNCLGSKGAVPPSNSTHYTSYFPPYSIFRPKCNQKVINIFSHIHGLSLKPIPNIWSAL